MIRILSFATLTALLMGCTTMKAQRLYDGEPRDVAHVARLFVPTDIDVTHVGGSHVKRTYALPGGDTQELHVLPGEHVVKARYAIVRDVSEWEHISFSSDFAQFVFTARAGQSYTIAYDEPDPRAIEREMSIPVDIWVEDAQGHRISEKVTREIRYTRADAGGVQPPVEPAHPTSGRSPAEPVSSESSALIQLQAWWLDANESEKSEFLDWIRAER